MRHSDATKAEALRLVAAGYRPVNVARHLGINAHSLSNWINSPPSDRSFHCGVSPEVKQQAYAMWIKVPKDTRDVTGRQMGDPLTGRSALDKRNGS